MSRIFWVEKGGGSFCRGRSVRPRRRMTLDVVGLEDRKLLASPDITPPTTVAAVVSGTLGHDGFYGSPVTVQLSATDPDNTPAQLTTFFTVNGGAQMTGNTVKLTADGIYTIDYHSVDPANNVEMTHALVVKIDQTAPVVTISASPSTLWPPNHKFVPVVVSGTVTDNLSGPAGLISFHVVDEYGQVQPSGVALVRAHGSYSFVVFLQASRTGQDKDGRQYTIFVTAADRAGNRTTVSTVVTVPHDQGQHGGNGSADSGGGGNSQGDPGGNNGGNGKGHGHGHGKGN